MTNKIEIVEVQGEEHVIIDHGNEQFTSMLKSEYDRRQAEQFTPDLPGGNIE